MLQTRPWGVGVPIFAAVLVGACFIVRGPRVAPIPKSTFWLGIAVLPMAALFAWRDADGLRVLNGLLLFLTVGLVALRASVGAVYATSLSDLLLKGPMQWFTMLSDGSAVPIADVKWSALKEKSHARRYAAVGRGLALAFAPVVLFIVLLANADAVFEKVVSPSFSLDPEIAIDNLFVGLLIMVLSAGLLRKLFLYIKKPPVTHPPLQTPTAALKLGITEIETVLIALNAVVGLFVAIQFRYLFGGANLVQGTTGLTYAEYARRGFFELLTVVAISVPILVAMNGLLHRERRMDQRIFRCTAGLFIVQLFIVAASAIERMRLYVDFFSLSPLRLYALAGMAFLVGVLALFLGTTLRGRPDRFAFCSLTWLATVVIGLNVLNPDAVIAKYNLQDRPGQRVDVALLASLSSDATPVLIGGMDHLSDEDEVRLRQSLNNDHQRNRYWTSMTLSYADAMSKWNERVALKN